MSLLDVLWPIRCAGCEKYGAPLCLQCGLDLAALELGEPSASGGIAAAFRYTAVARSLVLGLKVRCLRPYSDPLACGIAALLQRGPFVPDLVSWVPARPSARRHRGFDQAELLARAVARRTGLPCAPTLRAHERQDQVGLGRAMRASNASSAFELSLRRPLRGSRLALIDDLITSGATARACMAVLKGGGSPEVTVLAACRA